MTAKTAADSSAASSPSEIVRQRLQRVRAHLRRLGGSERFANPQERQTLDAIELEIAGIEAVVDALKQVARADSTPPPLQVLEPAPSELRILVAEDDADLRSLLKELLDPHYSVVLVGDGSTALELLQQKPFHLAIVDVQLPRLSGFEVAERLRERAGRTSPQAFMFLSAQSGPEFKVRGLELGAADYVTKPFHADELLARVARILAATVREENLRADALTDSLTGLANYRSFSASLEREFARSQRYDQPLCLLTIDLDRLKAINDGSGHQAGNEAIRLVAQVLKDGVRSFEVVARQGGDEFGVLLPNTTEVEAVRLSERLRKGVESKSIYGAALSVSVGVAARERGSQITLRQLVERSDEALYQAKRAGRNRISSSGVAKGPAKAKDA